MQNIKRNPANAASLKMEHFSNIGVTEVFLEATPTTFVTTVLMVFSVSCKQDAMDCGLYNVVIGSGYSGVLFWVGYVASTFSSAFGVSR